MAPSSLAPSSAPGCTSPFVSASPPPWPDGASASGALRSRHGGGLGLPPPGLWLASLFLAQASARAPWAPPQLAHLTVICGQRCPRPTRHPLTEHPWSIVWWSLAQIEHRGAAAWQWGVMCPTHCAYRRKHLAAIPPRRRQPRTAVLEVGHHSFTGVRRSPRRGKLPPLMRCHLCCFGTLRGP